MVNDRLRKGTGETAQRQAGEIVVSEKTRGCSNVGGESLQEGDTDILQ